MKFLLVLLINLYKICISPVLKTVLGGECRFSPTCSEYARQAIIKHGALKGGYVSALRLLKCQPFFK